MNSPHLATSALIVSAALIGGIAQSGEIAKPESLKPALAPESVGARAFDFLFGHWQVRNRRLLHRLKGSSEWETFDAANDCHSILGGGGNQDEFVRPDRPGFIGMSLRLYDPQAGQWSIYWVDNQSHVLQPPVVGRFSRNRGVFEGPDLYDGKPILVRFIWSGVDGPNPRWEQAFSSDQGATWETNWIMDFHRPSQGTGA